MRAEMHVLKETMFWVIVIYWIAILSVLSGDGATTYFEHFGRVSGLGSRIKAAAGISVDYGVSRMSFVGALT